MADESALSAAAHTQPRTDTMSLAGALASLDPANDADWTSSGLPRIEALEALTGVPVSRADVDDLAPDLRRDGAPEPSDPPPADNAHVADGAEQFPETVAAPEKSPQAVTAEADAAQRRDGLSPEERLLSLEEDLAFLRAVYGWPNKA